MNYNSNKSDDEQQEHNAPIVAIGAIIFAAIFENVMPHFLNPVPTNMLGIKSEKGPIYGILSSEIQSSVDHLYKVSEFSYISLA